MTPPNQQTKRADLTKIHYDDNNDHYEVFNNNTDDDDGEVNDEMSQRQVTMKTYSFY